MALKSIASCLDAFLHHSNEDDVTAQFLANMLVSSGNMRSIKAIDLGAGPCNKWLLAIQNYKLKVDSLIIVEPDEKRLSGLQNIVNILGKLCKVKIIADSMHSTNAYEAISNCNFITGFQILYDKQACHELVNLIAYAPKGTKIVITVENENSDFAKIRKCLPLGTIGATSSLDEFIDKINSGGMFDWSQCLLNNQYVNIPKESKCLHWLYDVILGYDGAFSKLKDSAKKNNVRDVVGAFLKKTDNTLAIPDDVILLTKLL